MDTQNLWDKVDYGFPQLWVRVASTVDAYHEEYVGASCEDEGEHLQGAGGGTGGNPWLVRALAS